MADERQAVVAVSPSDLHADRAHLFATLGAACDVRFVPDDGDLAGAAALIAAGERASRSVAAAHARGLRVLEMAEQGADRLEDVRIETGAGVAEVLRGAVLPGQRTSRRIELDEREEVLASADAGPAWTRTRDGASVRVRAPVPLLAAQESLRALFGPADRARSLALLAMVAFLRELAGDRWSAPALRATFVFDDPNLRRVRYGHIDYRRLADEAARHSYHVSMAMVPIDARHTGAAAVAIFRAAAPRLSLVVHGNDHTRAELLRATDEHAARALVAQALRRVERFEARTALEVGRVMVPPHGMASRSVAAALAQFGFDGLCSLHPLPWTERTPGEQPLAGWTPATFVEGCAVIRRMPFHASSADIALGAYLGQPLILYGHHGDLAPGYGVLAQAAERINGLGAVRWCSLREIVRANYQLRVADGVAQVRPWGTRLEVVLPAEVERFTVLAPPPLDGAALGVSGWSLEGDERARRALGEAVGTNGARRARVRLLPAAVLEPRDVPRRRTPPRAWARRRAAELRDRVSPGTAVAASAIRERR